MWCKIHIRPLCLSRAKFRSTVFYRVRNCRTTSFSSFCYFSSKVIYARYLCIQKRLEKLKTRVYENDTPSSQGARHTGRDKKFKERDQIVYFLLYECGMCLLFSHPATFRSTVFSRVRSRSLPSFYAIFVFCFSTQIKKVSTRRCFKKSPLFFFAFVDKQAIRET